MLSAAIPDRLERLQKKIEQLAADGKIVLQNGDRGYASAPSNIALIKYWGKNSAERQIPANSSVSLTLGDFRSKTCLEVRGRCVPPGFEFSPPNSFSAVDFSLNGKVTSTPTKVTDRIREIFSTFASGVGFRVTSENNFPTACGIASSASGFAALVGAAADLLQLQKHFSADDLQYWLVEWARLGSGSATRSAILGDDCRFVAWERDGEKTVTRSVPWSESFSSLEHTVVIVDSTEKSVASSEGHLSALTSPLHRVRLASVQTVYQKAIAALECGDWQALQETSEGDAFAMHAVMLSSTPSLRYLTQDSILVIETLLTERNANNAKILWTADAGPNIHLIFDSSARPFVLKIIKKLEERLGRKLECLSSTSFSGLRLGREGSF